MNHPATVVLDAEPFCFGPISTTLNVARELRSLCGSSLRLVLLGTLTASQLARRSELLDEVIECDTSNEQALLKHRSLIEGARCYLSNTNFNSVDLIRRLELRAKVALVDTLFWMWDELPAAVYRADALYVQDFFGVRERLAGVASALPHARVFPPLVRHESKASRARDKLVLVNLGGIENIYSKSGYRARELSALALSVLQQHPKLEGYDIQVCGGGQQIESIRAELESKERRTSVSCLPQERYLALLGACSYFLTVPGLTSYVESVHHAANTFFLLPQNYSQYLQLDRIRQHSPGTYGMNWNDFPELPPILPLAPELEGLQMVSRCNQAFFASSALQARFQDAVRRYIDVSPQPAAVQLPFHDAERNGPRQLAQTLVADFGLAS